jgi:hypothetical protein
VTERTETLEGYLVDAACIRKYPHEQLGERARKHTKKCALMGHCVESGYGLIDDEGRIYLLDAEATPQVVEAVKGSGRDAGIRLRALRSVQGEEMKTESVEEV